MKTFAALLGMMISSLSLSAQAMELPEIEVLPEQAADAVNMLRKCSSAFTHVERIEFNQDEYWVTRIERLLQTDRTFYTFTLIREKTFQKRTLEATYTKHPSGRGGSLTCEFK